MCTGNIVAVKDGCEVEPVYPCVYREHTSSDRILMSRPGLSLCVQGTLFFIGFHIFERRFIPVCTGNTLNDGKESSSSSVYPCVYREHGDDEDYLYIIIGLSLCVQGTPAKADSFLNYSRFIPVCTGNTLFHGI